MRSLSLFSGIGGFELAAAALNCFTVEQFVEIDEDAQYVLFLITQIQRRYVYANMNRERR
jgi:site-specific DNA-cytosine methylase